MVNVRKADGTLQPFDRKKILKTCRRLKLSEEEAEEVVKKVEENLYDGITTKEILEMVFKFGEKHKSHLGSRLNLREALALMRPKPDFEKFVALLLEHAGYKTVTNKILQGKCIDHEIDVIATRGSETLYVEVKHHAQFHTFTGLDTFLEVNSSFQDLAEGYALRKHEHDFTKPMVVLNTKISEHARKYSGCRKIGTMAWGIPEDRGIDYYIDEKQLLPLTIIKNADMAVIGKLGDSGVYTLRQLVEADKKDLAHETKVRPQVLEELIEKANRLLSS